jgi:hypothetical protein
VSAGRIYAWGEMSKKGTAHTCFYEGETYVSVAGLKKALGLSRSKVMRLEAQGRIPRPGAIPRGARGARWYSEEDLQQIAEVLASERVLRSERDRVRPFSEYARPGRRRARAQVDVDAEEEPDFDADGEDVGERAGVPLGGVQVRRRPWRDIEQSPAALGEPTRAEPRKPAKAPRCPRCKGELIHETDGVARCPVHGVVDIRPPAAPVEGACVSCGSTEVLHEVDHNVPGGFRPTCPRCGPCQVHGPKETQKPLRDRSFSASRFATGGGRRQPHGRPRGLRLGDIVVAVRRPAPPAAPTVSFLDPYEAHG